MTGPPHTRPGFCYQDCGEGVQMRRRTRRIGRRGLLLGTAAVGMSALASPVTGAQEQRSPGPGDIEWLDYDPPRDFAAGARVGNVVYLSGVAPAVPGGIMAQTARAFEVIQTNLRAYGSDLAYIFKMTVYLVNIDDQPGFAQVRAR